jgi:hypothetical protein
LNAQIITIEFATTDSFTDITGSFGLALEQISFALAMFTGFCHGTIPT